MTWATAARKAAKNVQANVSREKTEKPRLLNLDAGGLDHRPPFLDLGLVVHAERPAPTCEVHWPKPMV
jgi:hypothetical protein